MFICYTITIHPCESTASCGDGPEEVIRTIPVDLFIFPAQSFAPGSYRRGLGGCSAVQLLADLQHLPAQAVVAFHQIGHLLAGVQYRGMVAPAQHLADLRQ